MSLSPYNILPKLMRAEFSDLSNGPAYSAKYSRSSTGNVLHRS